MPRMIAIPSCYTLVTQGTDTLVVPDIFPPFSRVGGGARKVAENDGPLGTGRNQRREVEICTGFGDCQPCRSQQPYSARRLPPTLILYFPSRFYFGGIDAILTWNAQVPMHSKLTTRSFGFPVRFSVEFNIPSTTTPLRAVNLLH
jgi:hypothetical protein